MRRQTILVTDDDLDVSEALETVLSDAGYDVALVPNGREALSYLWTRPAPSLILLDLMMPVMDGYEFRAAQLADPVLKTIPVVILTAGTVDRQVLGLGAQGLLRKPVDLDTLLETVKRHVAQNP